MELHDCKCSHFVLGICHCIIYRQIPIFLLLTKDFLQSYNAKMATFYHLETACPHLSKQSFTIWQNWLITFLSLISNSYWHPFQCDQTFFGNKTLYQRLDARSKNPFLRTLSNFFVFSSFFSFLHKNFEKNISTSVWIAQHPNTGQNIQHTNIQRRSH